MVMIAPSGSSRPATRMIFAALSIERLPAPDTQGRWHILGSAAHKVSNPVLFRVEEVQACYAAIACPVLTLLAEENRLHEWQGGQYGLADYLQRLSHIGANRTITIAKAGHMLHHDQPLAVAQAMQAFLQT